MKKMLGLLIVMGICSQLYAMKRCNAFGDLTAVAELAKWYVQFQTQTPPKMQAVFTDNKQEPELILGEDFVWPKKQSLKNGFLYKPYNGEPRLILDKKNWSKNQSLYETVK